MSKLATRCSVILIASGLSGLLTGCPQTPAPTTNVKPIPGAPSTNISPTPAPSSGLIPIPPGSSATPGPSGEPGVPTPTPAIPGQLTITTTGLPTGVLNFAYSYSLQVASGSGSYRWSVTSGNLPNGLSLDPNTGQIFGTPTQTGTYSFELQVIDNQKATVARRNMFILVADSDSGLNNLAILTDDLPTATVDRRYSRSLEVSGGTAPFSWSISGGALPDGLDLNNNTGEISGTPTLQGEETFTVRVTDAKGQTETRTLSITVNSTDTDITILTASLPVGVLDTDYNREACGQTFAGLLKATGGDGDYRWEISKGSLPPGLTLQKTGSNAGNITGSPSSTGSYTFTARLRDGEDNGDSKVFTIEVQELMVHNFTPNTGGEDLRVVVFGENLGAADELRFGGVSTTDISVSNVDGCDQLTTHIPAGAKTGVLSLRSGGEEIGSSKIPFIAEHVVINEVFGSPDASGNQFIALKNLGSSSVSIAGWHLFYTNVDGELEDFTIPSETPPLVAGATTKVKINRNGGTSASAIYTGTALDEMRFDPDNASGNELTQIALCKGSPCNDNDDQTDTNYRDYLQFGADDADGGTLEDEAVSSGIWQDDSTFDARGLSAALQDVSEVSGDPDAAHYGVAESGYAQSGLYVENGDEEYSDYLSDTVLYFTPTGGIQAGLEQRIRRTVTGTGDSPDEDRVRINSPIFSAQISSSNTGNGNPGNGISVSSVNLFSPNDFVNIITGSTIRTITAISGTKLELDSVLAAETDDANTSDGTGSGFLVGSGQEAIVNGASTVNITMRDGETGEFSVVRNLVSTSTDRIVINQALAAAPLSTTNTGDGTTGFETTVTSVTNFVTGDLVLYNGQPCEDGAPCEITIGGSQFRLSQPIAQMQISEDNVGDGSTGNRIEVEDTSGFATGNAVLINGQPRIVQAITPGFGDTKPKVQLNQTLSMVVNSANLGDGVDEGILVNATAGFAAGKSIRINGEVRQIASIAPGNKIMLDSILTPATTVGVNTGDGTLTAPLKVANANAFVAGNKVRFPAFNQVRTVSNVLSPTTLQLDSAVTSNVFSTVTTPAANGVDVPITLVDASVFEDGDMVRFANGQIREIASVNTGTNQITLSSALPTNVSSGTVSRLLEEDDELTFVPNSGTVVAVGNSDPDFAFVLNLVPKSGQFTLVPSTDHALISRIPTSGSIFLAPSNGVLRKYQSLMFNGSANQNQGDYTVGTPTSGQ